MYVTSCGPGTVFSPSLQVCVWPTGNDYCAVVNSGGATAAPTAALTAAPTGVITGPPAGSCKIIFC